MLETLGRFRFYKYPYLQPYWKGEETRAMIDCFVKNRMILGPSISELENEIQKAHGSHYVFGTNSGRAAIQLILESMRRDDRNEVLVPSFGCSGIIQPIVQSGMRPVFLDIGMDLNVDIDYLAESMTDKTRALIVPNMSGQPAEWAAIGRIARENDLFVIDDAAQAVGARYKGKPIGTLGDAGIFSFTLGKIISATGGGAILTNSEELSEKLTQRRVPNEHYFDVSFRAAGVLMRGKYRSYTLPFFSIKNLFMKFARKNKFEFTTAKISNIDASICLEQLKRIDEIILLRRRNAKILDDELSGIDSITLPERTADSVFTKYIVKFDSIAKTERLSHAKEAKDFAIFLAKAGIETEWSYTPLHLRIPFSKYHKLPLPYTDEVWRRLITLPLNPNFDEEQMKYIASKAKGYFNR